tara:strand:+ start:17 stop:736 length:720 start_codon:yes stop_codon:yes gene_type:complete
MIINSSCIILNNISYGESDLIVKILTQKKGLLSFLIKGGQKKKKKYLQPLMNVNISFNYKNKTELFFIKSIEFKNIINNILTNYRKRNMALFLCKIISNSISINQEDSKTYDFIANSISWLNSKHCSGKYFELWFLINLTKFLGFAPDYLNLKLNVKYKFNPQNGEFYLEKTSNNIELWNSKISEYLYNFLITNVEELDKFSLSYNDYKSLIVKVLNYYELHISEYNYKKLIAVYTELL